MMKFIELTDTIISAAYDVYNKMGAGFLATVYENCLLIELPKRGLKARGKRPFDVYYDNQLVGEFVADIIVEEKVIVKVLALPTLLPLHELNLLNLLTAANLEVGLLINFSPATVEVKQQVRELSKSKRVGTKPLGKTAASQKQPAVKETL